jgi:hypothetical protein
VKNHPASPSCAPAAGLPPKRLTASLTARHPACRAVKREGSTNQQSESTKQEFHVGSRRGRSVGCYPMCEHHSIDGRSDEDGDSQPRAHPSADDQARTVKRSHLISIPHDSSGHTLQCCRQCWWRHVSELAEGALNGSGRAGKKLFDLPSSFRLLQKERMW